VDFTTIIAEFSFRYRQVPESASSQTAKNTHYTLSAFHSIVTVERTFGSFRSKRPRCALHSVTSWAPRESVGRHVQANRLGGFQIDDELEFALLLHRQIGWPLSDLPS
jgi:hypothetical protein